MVSDGKPTTFFDVQENNRSRGEAFFFGSGYGRGGILNPLPLRIGFSFQFAAIASAVQN